MVCVNLIAARKYVQLLCVERRTIFLRKRAASVTFSTMPGAPVVRSRSLRTSVTEILIHRGVTINVSDSATGIVMLLARPRLEEASALRDPPKRVGPVRAIEA
mgnify:CR=1 FL=1